MQNTFNKLSGLLGNLGGGIFALVPLVAVILIVIIINRILNRQAQRTTGLRFRNQLIITAVSFVGVLVVIVVLPLDAGVRGQLLTLIGIIISVTISLSSSTFLGNAMAGIMLKTVRNFRSGDFVQIGEHFGCVHPAPLSMPRFRWDMTFPTAGSKPCSWRRPARPSSRILSFRCSNWATMPSPIVLRACLRIRNGCSRFVPGCGSPCSIACTAVVSKSSHPDS